MMDATQLPLFLRPTICLIKMKISPLMILSSSLEDLDVELEEDAEERLLELKCLKKTWMRMRLKISLNQSTSSQLILKRLSLPPEEIDAEPEEEPQERPKPPPEEELALDLMMMPNSISSSEVTFLLEKYL